MVDSPRTQHHTRGFWGRPFLSGPVAWGSWKAVQLWRPGDLDFDRCSTDRRWLRGTRRRFSLHLKRSSTDSCCFMRQLLLPKIQDPVFLTRFACLSALHNTSPSANTQKVFSSAASITTHTARNLNHSCQAAIHGVVQEHMEQVISCASLLWLHWCLNSPMLINCFGFLWSNSFTDILSPWSHVSLLPIAR